MTSAATADGVIFERDIHKCGKVPYPTRRDSERAANRRGRDRPGEFHFYICPHCSADRPNLIWHVSSMGSRATSAVGFYRGDGTRRQRRDLDVDVLDDEIEASTELPRPSDPYIQPVVRHRDGVAPSVN